MILPPSARRRALVLVAWIVGCAIVFAVVAVGTRAEAGLPFDEPLLAWLGTQQSTAATRIALALDILGISYLLLPASALLAFALAESRRLRAAWFLLASVYGAVALNLAAKAYFRRTRPELLDQLTPVTNASFPSGHAMGSFAFSLALMMIGARLLPRHRGSIGGLLLLFAVGVGVSRVYLQVHFPSDILAAWALSGAWVAAMMLWYPPPIPGPVEPMAVEERGR